VSALSAYLHRADINHAKATCHQSALWPILPKQDLHCTWTINQTFGCRLQPCAAPQRLKWQNCCQDSKLLHLKSTAASQPEEAACDPRACTGGIGAAQPPRHPRATSSRYDPSLHLSSTSSNYAPSLHLCNDAVCRESVTICPPHHQGTALHCNCHPYHRGTSLHCICPPHQHMIPLVC